MNRFGVWLVASSLFVGAAAPLSAQSADPSLLTLERIYASREFVQEFFGPARWLGDGTGYTTLEWSQDVARARDIVRYDPATGERELLVPASRLVPPGQTTPLWISGYTWSEDARRLLIFTNTEVWIWHGRRNAEMRSRRV